MARMYTVHVTTKSFGTVALDQYRGDIHLAKVQTIDWARLEKDPAGAGHFTLAEARRLSNVLGNLGTVEIRPVDKCQYVSKRLEA